MSLTPMGQPLGGAVMALQDGAENAEVREANLPDSIGIFLSGGYITGNVGELPGYAQPRDMDGYYIAGGVEYYPSDNTMVGLSGYYSSLDADTPLAQRVNSDTYAASIYVRHNIEDGPIIDGQLSIGSLGFDTRRQVQFLGAGQTLTSSSADTLISGALGVSYDLNTSIGTISPVIEARYASVDLGTLRETGGTLALQVARQKFKSTQTRFGFDGWTLTEGPILEKGITGMRSFVVEPMRFGSIEASSPTMSTIAATRSESPMRAYSTLRSKSVTEISGARSVARIGAVRL